MILNSCPLCDGKNVRIEKERNTALADGRSDMTFRNDLTVVCEQCGVHFVMSALTEDAVVRVWNHRKRDKHFKRILRESRKSFVKISEIAEEIQSAVNNEQIDRNAVFSLLQKIMDDESVKLSIQLKTKGPLKNE